MTRATAHRGHGRPPTKSQQAQSRAVCALIAANPEIAPALSDALSSGVGFEAALAVAAIAILASQQRELTALRSLAEVSLQRITELGGDVLAIRGAVILNSSRQVR